jgi:flavin reductase (DIM6/NTAB) family NADH-FMN oxidoreductase RutF
MAAEQAVSEEWIELKDAKQFSRLLYTNPVCFFSTANAEQRNVMVLSWLTATNNEGRFMFSLNRRRHTASILSEGCNFVLSIPVKGMEDLVKAVGGTSGRRGSKFAEDHPPSENQEEATVQEVTSPPLSQRQKKKLRLPRPISVAGLNAVTLGHQPIPMDRSEPFAVDGTVAHLQCKAYSIMQDPVIDDDHYLVLAEVTHAFVKRSYWDNGKKLFRASATVPPHLTFFGSQTFGYVGTS